MEWGPDKTPREQLQHMLSGQLTTAQMIRSAPASPALRDDRPVNEYFMLRAAALVGNSR
jgi:hypothetical protein